MASDVFHQLYYHFVWSTHQRQPMLSDAVAKKWLIGAVAAEAVKRKGRVLACNAMPDHVHLLVGLPPCDLPRFIGQVKGATSYAFNREFLPKFFLKWQDGYGVVSMRGGDTETTTHYVCSQEQIHAKRHQWATLEMMGSDEPQGFTTPSNSEDSG